MYDRGETWQLPNCEPRNVLSSVSASIGGQASRNRTLLRKTAHKMKSEKNIMCTTAGRREHMQAA